MAKTIIFIFTISLLLTSNVNANYCTLSTDEIMNKITSTNNDISEITTTTITKPVGHTIGHINATGINSENAISKAFDEKIRVLELLSNRIEGSEISKINNNSGEWVPVSEETFDIIKLGLEISTLTQGAYDITCGNLIKIWWGLSKYSEEQPCEEELKAALASVDHSNVKLDNDQTTVKIPEDTNLNLNKLAVGYALDRGVHTLRNFGIEHALVSLEGNVSAIGSKPDNQPWGVGIQDPDDPSQIKEVIELEDSLIATEGNYHYHIINPLTGRPATGLTSVSVIANTNMEAITLAYAIFSLGIRESFRLVEELSDVETVIIDSQGQLWTSSGLQSEFSSADRPNI